MLLDINERFHPDIDPSQVEGKVIRKDDLTTRTFNTLARMGYDRLEDGEKVLDAGAVAETSADELNQLSEAQVNWGSAGIGKGGRAEISKLLEKLAEI